ASHDTRWQELMKDLEPNACWFDVLSPGYLAISATPDKRDDVESYLARRTAAGELDFERGRS
ncbi:hypothetical protein, partial [Brenneria goodwinii]|uniref:hypothetical protein n=1 Tax=Brenneria goodwinii TaxID=1109412 RepID=UPI001EFBD5A5